MAYWTRTIIEITGQKETLLEIYKAIETCNDLPESLEDYYSNNWVGNIFKLLHMNTKRHEYYSFWSEPRFNKYGHLVFNEYAPAGSSNDAEALKQKFFYEISGINYIPIY